MVPRLFSLAVYVALLAAGCCNIGSASPQEVKNSLYEISEGTPVDSAEKVLRQKGFEVVQESNGVFAYRTSNCFFVEDRVIFAARVDDLKLLRDIHVGTTRIAP